MSEYAALPYAYGEIERRTIYNRETDSYLLYVVGWDGSERVHGIVSHIDIINDKIYIQRDGTEDGLATRARARRRAEKRHRVGLARSRIKKTH